jgi:hypothetical protein
MNVAPTAKQKAVLQVTLNALSCCPDGSLSLTHTHIPESHLQSFSSSLTLSGHPNVQAYYKQYMLMDPIEDVVIDDDEDDGKSETKTKGNPTEKLDLVAVCVCVCVCVCEEGEGGVQVQPKPRLCNVTAGLDHRAPLCSPSAPVDAASDGPE